MSAMSAASAATIAAYLPRDRVERLETVRLMVRGGYRQTGGQAFEFPDSLLDIRADYEMLTDKGLLEKLNTLAEKEGAAAATKEGVRLLAIIDRILPRIQASKDFDNPATKTEMLGRLNLFRLGQRCRIGAAPPPLAEIVGGFDCLVTWSFSGSGQRRAPEP